MYFWNLCSLCCNSDVNLLPIFPLIKGETKRSNNQRESKTHTKTNITFETSNPAENRQPIWDAAEYPKKKGNQIANIRNSMTQALC